MNLRQRFEAVFSGRTPDVMAFYGDMTYWYAAHCTMGDLPAKWRGPRGIGQLHRDLNVGEYVPGCCAYEMSEGPEVQCKAWTDDGIHTVHWHTPVGTLKLTQQYSPDSFSSGYTEHAVKTVEDLKVLRYIMENRQYRPCPERIEEIDRDYGGFGVPIVAVPGSPVDELNKTWMGVMAMCYMLADEPQEVEKTLQAIGEGQNRLYEITEQCDCRYVMICENLTATTMGGYFDRYIAPYLRARVEGLHRNGKKCLIHIDGTLRGVIEKVWKLTGIDCIDSLTPAPVGDVAVEDIRTLAGEEILILGGLPGAMFAPPFTARDMEEHVRKIIRFHKNSGRFMFGVADQVPPNGDLNLVKLVSDLVEEHGRY